MQVKSQMESHYTDKKLCFIVKYKIVLIWSCIKLSLYVVTTRIITIYTTEGIIIVQLFLFRVL